MDKKNTSGHRTGGLSDYSIGVLFTGFVLFVTILLGVALAWPVDGSHYTYRIGARLFIFTLLSPVIAAALALVSFILFFTDRRPLHESGFAPAWSFLLILSLLVGSVLEFHNLLIGVFFFLLIVSWVIVVWRNKRLSFNTDWFSLGKFWQSKWYQKLYLVFAVYVLGQATISFISNMYYTNVAMWPGQPEYRVQSEHHLRTSVTRATRNFPDAQSCLQTGADAARRQDLLRMDWDKVETTSDAEVCIFRLLHGWGGVSEAAAWLKAQDFTVNDRFSSGNFYENRDGTLRVDGGWSIKKHGLRFPTSGFITRILGATPYGMGVRATFSQDGNELLFVNIDYSTM